MSAFEEAKWNLVESDPGVFSLLIHRLGARGVEIEELWSLDDESFADLKPVHGLIFLFKWVRGARPAGEVVDDGDARMQNIYFAKQVVPDACATFAVLSLLMNCSHPDLELGPELTAFKEFSMPLKPDTRGLATVNNASLREIHNSMERMCFFEMKSEFDNPEDKGKDAFHFVAYVPIDGKIYELDGLKPGPIDVGSVAPDKDWIDVVRPIIQKRMETYNQGEIHFNLMALVSDRKMVYERKLNELLKKMETSQMNSSGVEEEIAHVRMLIECQESKMARYKMEMARRKHNYIPFLIELLKILAEKRKLMPMYELAKKRAEGLEKDSDKTKSNVAKRKLEV